MRTFVQGVGDTPNGPPCREWPFANFQKTRGARFGRPPRLCRVCAPVATCGDPSSGFPSCWEGSAEVACSPAERGSLASPEVEKAFARSGQIRIAGSCEVSPQKGTPTREMVRRRSPSSTNPACTASSLTTVMLSDHQELLSLFWRCFWGLASYYYTTKTDFWDFCP